jgi:hypothetical protein
MGLEGCGAEIAPVIGFGISQNRDHSARIRNPHGFSMEWLRLQPGQSLSPFTLSDKMVIIPQQSGLRLDLNDSGEVHADLGAWDTFSVPQDVVRSLTNTSGTPVETLVLVSGDHQKRPMFRPHILETAAREGYALDAQGYVANAHLIPNYGMVAE